MMTTTTLINFSEYIRNRHRVDDYSMSSSSSSTYAYDCLQWLKHKLSTQNQNQKNQFEANEHSEIHLCILKKNNNETMTCEQKNMIRNFAILSKEKDWSFGMYPSLEAIEYKIPKFSAHQSFVIIWSPFALLTTWEIVELKRILYLYQTMVWQGPWVDTIYQPDKYQLFLNERVKQQTMAEHLKYDSSLQQQQQQQQHQSACKLPKEIVFTTHPLNPTTKSWLAMVNIQELYDMSWSRNVPSLFPLLGPNGPNEAKETKENSCELICAKELKSCAVQTKNANIVIYGNFHIYRTQIINVYNSLSQHEKSIRITIFNSNPKPPLKEQFKFLQQASLIIVVGDELDDCVYRAMSWNVPICFWAQKPISKTLRWSIECGLITYQLNYIVLIVRIITLYGHVLFHSRQFIHDHFNLEQGLKRLEEILFQSARHSTQSSAQLL